jgi:hypothetical protein
LINASLPVVDRGVTILDSGREHKNIGWHVGPISLDDGRILFLQIGSQAGLDRMMIEIKRVSMV